MVKYPSIILLKFSVNIGVIFEKKLNKFLEQIKIMP